MAATWRHRRRQGQRPRRGGSGTEGAAVNGPSPPPRRLGSFASVICGVERSLTDPLDATAPWRYLLEVEGRGALGAPPAPIETFLNTAVGELACVSARSGRLRPACRGIRVRDTDRLCVGLPPGRHQCLHLAGAPHVLVSPGAGRARVWQIHHRRSPASLPSTRPLARRSGGIGRSLEGLPAPAHAIPILNEDPARTNRTPRLRRRLPWPRCACC